MKIDDVLEVLRTAGEQLIPYNYPIGNPLGEADLAPLKHGLATADGYELELNYNKSNYGEYCIETVQILGVHVPFLPFNLITKIARKALGSKHLVFVEYYRGDRKVYAWSVQVDKAGKPVPSNLTDKSQPCVYEGFEYMQISTEELSYH